MDLDRHEKIGLVGGIAAVVAIITGLGVYLDVWIPYAESEDQKQKLIDDNQQYDDQLIANNQILKDELTQLIVANFKFVEPPNGTSIECSDNYCTLSGFWNDSKFRRGGTFQIPTKLGLEDLIIEEWRQGTIDQNMIEAYHFYAWCSREDEYFKPDCSFKNMDNGINQFQQHGPFGNQTYDLYR